MTQTKIDLVTAIIDILSDDLLLSASDMLHLRNMQQLKLQKLSNIQLKSILRNLEEGLK